MATKPRLCVNCKHYRKGYTFNCHRTVKVTYRRSVVTGKIRKDETDGDRATDERRWGGPHCGPEAKHYVEKRLTKRLIAMFKP